MTTPGNRPDELPTVLGGAPQEGEEASESGQRTPPPLPGASDDSVEFEEPASVDEFEVAGTAEIDVEEANARLEAEGSQEAPGATLYTADSYAFIALKTLKTSFNVYDELEISEESPLSGPVDIHTPNGIVQADVTDIEQQFNIVGYANINGNIVPVFAKKETTLLGYDDMGEEVHAAAAPAEPAAKSPDEDVSSEAERFKSFASFGRAARAIKNHRLVVGAALGIALAGIGGKLLYDKLSGSEDAEQASVTITPPVLCAVSKETTPEGAPETADRTFKLDPEKTDWCPGQEAPRGTKCKQTICTTPEGIELRIPTEVIDWTRTGVEQRLTMQVLTEGVGVAPPPQEPEEVTIEAQ